MARIFTDGAEFGDALFFSTVGGSAGASTVQKRTGNYSYILSGSTANFLTRNFTGLSELYFRGAIMVTAISTTRDFLLFRNSSDTIAKFGYNNTTGEVIAYVGNTQVATSITAIPLNTWTLVEVRVKVADALGVIQVKLDGVQVINYSGDTKPGSATTIDNFQVLGHTSFTFYLDDIAMNDTTGGSDNSWCNDGYVVALTVNGNGDSSQFTNSASTSVDNYSYIDETPPDGDTSYVESSNISDTDLYQIEDFSGTNKTIRRAFVAARAKSTGAVGDTLKLLVKSGSTTDESSDIPLLATYSAIVGTDYTTNPDTGLAWTDGDIDSLQIGQKVT